MKKKIYENKDGLKFVLNVDLTNDEAVEANNLLSSLMAVDGNTIMLRQTQEEQNRLLEIILVPQVKLPEGFSWGSFRSSISSEVITDFFLSVIEHAQNSISRTRRSIMQQNKLLRNMKL
ncbi:MAG: hypothetical protein HF314_11990 [Ignavibacteria bacterium]|nr:hypothetical protein [Ignavibacteria bacterium]MCU7503791.1 hypothetical protein [Ignavibacteria bacterium]MCU7517195.1 hypothetical protein [Ignavibacteria bacterium]